MRCGFRGREAGLCGEEWRWKVTDSLFSRRSKIIIKKKKIENCVNWYDLLGVNARALATELHALSAPVCSASNQASLRAATGARRVETRTPQATVEACGSLCYTAATSLSTNQRAAVRHSSLIIITARVVILLTLLYRLLVIPTLILSNHAF